MKKTKLLRLSCDLFDEIAHRCAETIERRLEHKLDVVLGEDGRATLRESLLDFFKKVNVEVAPKNDDFPFPVTLMTQKIRGKLYGVGATTIMLGPAALAGVAVRAGNAKHVTTREHAATWLAERGLKSDEAERFVDEGLEEAKPEGLEKSRQFCAYISDGLLAACYADQSLKKGCLTHVRKLLKDDNYGPALCSSKLTDDKFAQDWQAPEKATCERCLAKFEKARP